MKTLLIGNGEVGQALFDVLRGTHETYIRDIQPLEIDGIEVLHICYPEHDGFVETTKAYIEQYKPKLTVINSSVSVGTTAQFSSGVVYSPIRGRHPKLASDLGIFTKFVFGINREDRELAKKHFEQCGLDVYIDSDPSAGEFYKLISNVHMGLEIAWRQEVERMLKAFKVSSSIYQDWEDTYRNGYLKSGDNHLIRPSMKPVQIGGHCILPCTGILINQFPSKILDFILESNEKAKREATS